jgi:hypothetical protein
MATNLHLSKKGLHDALQQRGIVEAVNDMADRVADQVRVQGIGVGDRDGGSHEIELPVKVDVYTSDRPRASVVINHPAGLSVQAKDGALTRAAAALGLEVNG